MDRTFFVIWIVSLVGGAAVFAHILSLRTKKTLIEPANVETGTYLDTIGRARWNFLKQNGIVTKEWDELELWYKRNVWTLAFSEVNSIPIGTDPNPGTLLAALSDAEKAWMKANIKEPK